MNFTKEVTIIVVVLVVVWLIGLIYILLKYEHQIFGPTEEIEDDLSSI